MLMIFPSPDNSRKALYFTVVHFFFFLHPDSNVPNSKRPRQNYIRGWLLGLAQNNWLRNVAQPSRSLTESDNAKCGFDFRPQSPLRPLVSKQSITSEISNKTDKRGWLVYVLPNLLRFGLFISDKNALKRSPEK